MMFGARLCVCVIVFFLFFFSEDVSVWVYFRVFVDRVPFALPFLISLCRIGIVSYAYLYFW